jgi:simple sugar transport system ATP-binding protein
MMNQYSDTLINEFDIITPSRFNLAKNLSGGNKQRLVLARELAIRPKFLIANQPTRGLDVGATEYIRRKLLEQRDDGVAILLISEDLDEVLMLSDRVMVFYEGEIMGIFKPEEVSLDDIGLMMAGVKRMEVSA